MSLETNERWRWLKSGRKWPKWLRNPSLLKWVIFAATLAYRLLLVWYWFTKTFDR